MGLAALAAQLVCLALPPAALWLLAAFCVAAGVAARALRRRFWAALALTAALLMLLHNLFWIVLQKPLEELAGTRASFTAEVLETRPSYSPALRNVTLSVNTEALPGRTFRVQTVLEDAPEPGDLLEGEGTFAPLAQDSYRLGHLADGVFLCMEEADVACTGHTVRLSHRLLALRERLAEGFVRWLSEDLGGIAAAMTVGETRHLSSSIRDTFRLAGVSHLLVVSGMHLSAWWGMWFWAGRKLRLYRGAWVISLLAAVLFAMVCGFTPSMCRSLTAVVILCGAGVCMRRPDGLTSLGAAILLITLSNPYAAGDIGFLLSVTATAGVLVSRFAVGRLAVSKTWAETHARRWQKLCLRGLHTAAVPLFAALFTLPVQVGMNLGVSLVSLPVNLAVLALLPFQLGFGWAAIALSFLWPGSWLHGLVLAIAGLFTKLLYAVVAWFAQLPFGSVYVFGKFALFTVAVLFALGLLAWDLRLARWMAVIAPAGAALAFAVYSVTTAGMVTVAPVGSGYNPCLVAIQDGRAVVAVRGGKSNLAAVEEYLTMHRAEPALVIDLREEPPAELPMDEAGCVVRAADVGPLGEQYALSEDVTVAVWNQKGAKLCLLDIGGYTIAVGAGGGSWEGFGPVGTLLAGPSLPAGLEPRRILSAHPQYSWQIPEDCAWFYDPSPALRIRPGRSITAERSWI